MSFLKLDERILTSTLWLDRVGRDIFIVAGLKARPRVFNESVPVYAPNSTEGPIYTLPPGEYGFTSASGPGLVAMAGHAQYDAEDWKKGMQALVRLTDPDPDSRTPEFEGRRLARVDGGYIVLNLMDYRERDLTAAERKRRQRERERLEREAEAQGECHGVTTRDVTDVRRQTLEEQTTPLPPAKKRGGKAAEVTPEIAAAVAKFNVVFQRATGRRASLAPDRARDFAQRVADGYPPEFLVGLPVGWVAALTPDAERIRTTRPDFLLRNGTRFYRRGDEVKPTFDWTGTIWGALDRVRLTLDQAEILREAGALEWWKSKGARPAAAAETW